MLSVTNIGLSAIKAADKGGFLVNLASFKMSETDVSNLTDNDLASAEGMQGTPVFEGQISAIEVVSEWSIRLTLTIPGGIPVAGTWNLREVGIYLESGDLFAYGPATPAYEKSSDFSVNIYVIVVANRLGDVINVVTSQQNNLPSTPFVRSLPRASDSYQNAVLVLDEHVNDFDAGVSTNLALRSGPGGTQWSFVGYNRVYSGKLASLISSTEFTVDTNANGFWLNDGEEVIAQITSGLGNGYSRKLIYSKDTESFTCADIGWSQIDSNSVVAIWPCISKVIRMNPVLISIM
jgi:hypothetical protein